MYRFACFALDDRKSVLYAHGRPVALARKVVDTLAVLVEHGGEVTSKEELLARLWPDGFVEESNITQNIYLLRQAFRAHGVEAAIETVPCRGYRFALAIAPVSSPLSSASLRVRAGAIAAAAVAFAAVLAIGNGPPVHADANAGALPAVARHTALSAKDGQLYALGRYFWSLRDIAALRRSIDYFGEVARDEPRSALGYAGLSDAYLGLFDYQCESRGCPDIAAQAVRNAQAAVDADPSSAEAITSFAMATHVFSHDDAAAAREFARAIAADPKSARAHEWFGNLLLVRGQVDQAREQLEIAASLDPVSPATYGWLARAAYFQRRYGDAIAYARRALSISPNRFETRVLLGLAYQQNGDDLDAVNAFGRLAQTNASASTRALLAGAYAVAGHRATAEKLLASLDPANSDVAFAYIALHKYDVARADIKKVKFRNAIERAFFRMDPRLDALRVKVAG